MKLKAMPVHQDVVQYVWRVRTRLPERFGQRCRVNVRGAMNSAEVEFQDGFKVITSRNYLRKGPRAASSTERD